MDDTLFTYAPVCLAALLGAHKELWRLTVGQAIMEVNKATGLQDDLENWAKKSKPGALILDLVPEKFIWETLKKNFKDAAIVSEESKWTDEERDCDQEASVWFVCDPLDVSRDLEKFLKADAANLTKTVADVLYAPNARQLWNKLKRSDEKKRKNIPTIVTGSTSALTCIRDGLPEFSITFNHITKEVVLASDKGIVKCSALTSGKLKDLTIQEVLSAGKVDFLPLSSRVPAKEEREQAYKNFVAFTEGEDYQDNFAAARLCRPNKTSHCKKPTGPPRPLYLSTLHSTPVIGYIASNGEKIGEWIHWLPYVRFAKDQQKNPILKLYEIMHGQPCKHEKTDVLMSPNANQSLFKEVSEVNPGRYRLACERLVARDSSSPLYNRPGLFRTTLVVAPRDNQWVNEWKEKMSDERVQHIRFP
ncbi:hypothetical protein HYR99_29035 [Candidatus Poribacteria bacterium]|nr:hypothetical protein [Candidatus Poribacteria bacterium]